MIQEEKEEQERKKAKNEAKIARLNKQDKGDGPIESKNKTKKALLRTEKPMRTKVVIDPLLQYSIKELDYLYYVEGMSKEMIRDQGPNKIDMAFLPSDSDSENA